MSNIQPSGLHVTLNYRPLGLVRADTRNLRPDGMHVDTGVIRLPRDSDVEVTFSWRKDNRLQVRRLRARVTGRSPTGTDLIFEENARETAQALRDLFPAARATL